VAVTTELARIVALRATGLGDLLTVVPALRALAERFPDHELTLVTPRSLAPIVPLIGVVDSVMPMQGLGALSSSLERPHIAVNLHGSGPQSHRVLLALHPSRLISHRHRAILESADGPEWIEGVHDAVRWARLLDAHGVRCDPTRLQLARPDPILRRAVGATVVHPGAGRASRRWPLSRWVTVVRRLVADGRRVVLTGSVAERPANARLCEDAGLRDGDNMAGRTDSLDIASVVAHSSLILSSDTGIAHLATAFDVPSVTLFGPTAPDEWGPLVRRDLHRVLWAGQRGNPNADRSDEGLLRIDAGDVIAAYESLERSAGADAHDRATELMG